MHRKTVVLCGILLAFTPSFSGCSPSIWNKYPRSNILTVPATVSLWTSWIKDKGLKFDISLNLRNESPDPIIVMFGDIRCSRDGEIGVIKDIGKRTLDFTSGETRNFILLCRVETKYTGDIKVSVVRVYDNPTSDGKTVGKVIAQNLSLIQK